MSDLTNRLRGQYLVGVSGEFGTRDFSDFIPPISREAADRIDVLEEAVSQIACAEYGSEDAIALIKTICQEVLE